jgi:hypothetical protein
MIYAKEHPKFMTVTCLDWFLKFIGEAAAQTQARKNQRGRLV